MKFTLEIEIGKGTMHSYSDVCAVAIAKLKALNGMAAALGRTEPAPGDGGKVQDFTAAVVGKWYVDKRESAK